MKLALMLGYSGSKLDLPIDRIKLAEELGYHSVWTAEAYGSDAMTPLAYIAAFTKKIKLGTGIIQLAGRAPAMAAMQAQTIDSLAGGDRMIVGLGVSGPQIVEGWYGQRSFGLHQPENRSFGPASPPSRELGRRAG